MKVTVVGSYPEEKVDSIGAGSKKGTSASASNDENDRDPITRRKLKRLAGQLERPSQRTAIGLLWPTQRTQGPRRLSHSPSSKRRHRTGTTPASDIRVMRH